MLTKIKNRIIGSQNDKHFLEILYGSIWSFGGRTIAMILGLLLNLFITRYYGAESMGLFALINSFFAIALIFSLMGIDTAILRLVPEYRFKYFFSTLISLYQKIVLLIIAVSFIITAVCYFNIEWISKYLFDKVEINYLLTVATLFIVINALGALNLSFIRAFKEIKLFTVLEITKPFTKILSLLILSFLSINLNNPVYALFAGNVLFMIISFALVSYVVNLNRKLPSEIKIKKEYKVNYCSILSLSFPMFLTAALLILISQTDILMLGVFSELNQVGIYAIVMKLAVLSGFILGAINTMIAPKFSELYHNGQFEELKNVAKKSSKLMFWASLPIVGVLVIFGSLILDLFGHEFSSGYYSLLIIVLGQLIASMVGSIGFFS